MFFALASMKNYAAGRKTKKLLILLLADRLLANQHVLTCPSTFYNLSGKKLSFGVENISLPSRVGPLIVLAA